MCIVYVKQWTCLGDVETRKETCSQGTDLTDITKCPKYEKTAEYLVSGYCPSCRANQASHTNATLLTVNRLLTGDSDAITLLGTRGQAH